MHDASCKICASIRDNLENSLAQKLSITPVAGVSKFYYCLNV